MPLTAYSSLGSRDSTWASIFARSTRSCGMALHYNFFSFHWWKQKTIYLKLYPFSNTWIPHDVTKQLSKLNCKRRFLFLWHSLFPPHDIINKSQILLANKGFLCFSLMMIFLLYNAVPINQSFWSRQLISFTSSTSHCPCVHLQVTPPTPSSESAYYLRYYQVKLIRHF